jgi:hypothetical protein
VTADEELLVRDAFVWGYPLVVMHRTRALHCSRTPLGQLNHVDRLATPADRPEVVDATWFPPPLVPLAR